MLFAPRGTWRTTVTRESGGACSIDQKTAQLQHDSSARELTLATNIHYTLVVSVGILLQYGRLASIEKPVDRRCKPMELLQ